MFWASNRANLKNSAKIILWHRVNGCVMGEGPLAGSCHLHCWFPHAIGVHMVHRTAPWGDFFISLSCSFRTAKIRLAFVAVFNKCMLTKSKSWSFPGTTALVKSKTKIKTNPNCFTKTIWGWWLKGQALEQYSSTKNLYSISKRWVKWWNKHLTINNFRTS